MSIFYRSFIASFKLLLFLFAMQEAWLSLIGTVTRPFHQFSPDGNISTTVWWIVMKLCSWMIPRGWIWTFLWSGVLPTSRSESDDELLWHLWFWVKCLDHFTCVFPWGWTVITFRIIIIIWQILIYTDLWNLFYLPNEQRSHQPDLYPVFTVN